MVDLTRSTHHSILDGAPGRAELLHILQQAESSMRRFHKVSWRISDTKKMTLLCQVPSQKMNIINTKSSPYSHSQPVAEPHWTLTQSEDEKPDVIVWTHHTRDVDLLTNMMTMAQESHDEPQSTFEDQSITADFTNLTARKSPKSAVKQTGFSFKAYESPRQTMSSDLTLAGDLQNVDISNVLQTANLLNMSGKLSCTDKETQIDVFFKDGDINHASGSDPLLSDSRADLTPHQLILDLILWKSGKFRFYPGWTTSETSLKIRLESVLLEGATIADYNNALTDMGFELDCPLKRAMDLDSDKLRNHLKTGVPTDLDLQEKLYSKVKRGKVSARNIIDGLPKTSWIPAVYNLLHLDVLTIASDSVDDDKELESISASPFKEQESNELFRSDTKLLAQSTFLHFLNQEIVRCDHRSSLFSLLCLYMPPGHAQQCVDLKEAFDKLKREYDELGHFDKTDSGNFAIILPYRNNSMSFKFAESLISLLNEKSIEKDFHIGIATYNKPATNLETLIKHANEALDRSKKKNISICTHDKIEESNWLSNYKEAMNLKSEKNMEGAIAKLNECLLEAKSFDETDDRLTITLDSLSQAYMENNRYDLALTSLEIGMKLKERYYLPEDIAHCMFDLGKCYFKLRNYDQSETYLIRAAKTFTKIFGSDHETVGNVYHNLATLYHLTDRLKDGKTAYHKCLSIKRSLLGRTHPEVVKTQKNYMLLLQSESEEKVKDAEIGVISGEWRTINIEDPLGPVSTT